MELCAERLNNGELVGILCVENAAINTQYNIISLHAYSIEKIDVENQIVYLINPHDTTKNIAVPFSIIDNDDMYVQFADVV